MLVKLDYGKGGLGVEFPADRTTVIRPSHASGLPDERAALLFAKLWQQFEIPIHSRLPESDVITMHLKPCDDIGVEVIRRLDKLAATARVAVLPHGPLTVPYLPARPSGESSFRAKAKCDP